MTAADTGRVVRPRGWLADENKRCFLIAEAGVNHNGLPELAHRLVDVAAESGADAVKFQTFDPDALVAAGTGSAPYQRERGAGRGQLDMLRALALPETAWRELASHASERGLLFMSTAFDWGSLQLLLDLGVRALKVPSGELDNLPFISHLAECGLPLVVSTGLGTLEEVSAVVDATGAAPSIALLHCVTAYPASTRASNLLAMRTMSDAFHVPVGWSDHTRGSLTAIAAVALGASILEKHITTDRGLSGPDHSASADPNEFADYVAAVRATESALGDGSKRPAAEEAANRRFVRRSYHARRDLAPGDVIADGDVDLLRPADGLPPAAAIIGRVVSRRLFAGQPVMEADLR